MYVSSSTMAQSEPRFRSERNSRIKFINVSVMTSYCQQIVMFIHLHVYSLLTDCMPRNASYDFIDVADISAV